MKVTVNVGKKFVINTGNYSSVSPSVSLTIHEVPIEEVIQAHEDIDIIADFLIHKQIKDDAKTMAAMKKLGLGEYFKRINKEQMKEAVENSMNRIANITIEER